MSDLLSSSRLYGLEEHMEALGNRSPEAKILSGLWTVHKEHLSRKAVPNSNLFGSYSDHGQSHSAAIVNAVNRLLGPDRIRQLEETDTWLILECAYRHDLGMHVTAKEIIEFVKTHDYVNLLQTTREMDDEQLCEAATWLSNQREISNDFIAMSISDKAEFTVTHMQYLNMVLSGYYRNIHSKRSKDMVVDDYCAHDDSDIPDRIWKLISQICLGHTITRQEAFDRLHPDEQGLCMDTAHPRFVQTLLRLGDLLDLDNNRFNPYNLDQWAEDLPYESKANLIKHKAVKHFYVSPDRIEVEADIRVNEVLPVKGFDCLHSEGEALYKKQLDNISVQWNTDPPSGSTNGDRCSFTKLSADMVIGKLVEGYAISADEQLTIEDTELRFTEQAKLQNRACRLCSRWFLMLDNELRFFAINWVDIAPPSISGFAPKLSNKKIFWQGMEMDNETIDLKYSISHKRAASIIQGTGLYGASSSKKAIIGPGIPNKELVFIRELIQNAMDATKIQAFRYLKEGKFCDAVVNLGNETTKWNPITVMDNIGDYTEKFEVKVEICYHIDTLRTGKNKRRPRLIIKVKDVGIGIDDKSLKYMSMIGSPRSEKLIREIQQMPEWMRPNGSFGIGMQSVFGIVKEFRALSCSWADHKVRDIFFKTSENSGDLFAAERINNQTTTYGTMITVEMNETELERIYRGIDYNGCTNTERDIQSPLLDFSCDHLFFELNKHIEKVIGQDLFPITVTFSVNEITIDKYKIRRDGLYTELVELYKQMCKSLMKSPPCSLLLLNANGINEIGIDRSNVLMSSSFDTLRVHNRDLDKAVNSKMRCAISLSEFDGDMLLISSDGNTRPIPLIADPFANTGETGTIKILYYSEQHNVLLKMRLRDYENRLFIDEREKRTSALSPVKFFYRGMNVYDVECSRLLVYPCWDIEAHALYGEAEQIISISRNHLLVEAEHEARKRVTESADEALELLFSWLSKDENYQIMFLKEEVSRKICNGLYLSLLYHQIISAHNLSSRSINHQSLREKLQHNVFLRIPVLRNRQGGHMYVEKALIRDVFKGGVYDNWYIDPQDVPLTDKPRKVVSDTSYGSNAIPILVQDIFTGYVVGRGLTPRVKDIRVIERSEPYPFSYIHMLDKTNVTAFYIPEGILTRAVDDMLDTFMSNDYSYSSNTYPLLPALDSYSLLAVTDTPVEVPIKLASLGKYMISPLNLAQIKYIQENAQEIYKAINDSGEESMAFKKKIWLRAYLQIDNRDNDLSFHRLVRFVVDNVGYKNKETTPEKVEQCYLEVATMFLDMLIDKTISSSQGE